MPTGPKTFAFVEFAPVIEEFVGEQLGRVGLGNAAGRLAKLLPLPEALRRMFSETERETRQQAKEDGKMVIKVADAVKIVRETFTKLQEAADVLKVILPAPGTEAGQSLTPVDVAIRRLREDALRQDKPRLLKEKKVYTRKP